MWIYASLRFPTDLDRYPEKLGGFVCKERMEGDPNNLHILYAVLRYEKLGLRIKFVFQGEQIGGLWLNYTELKEELQ